MHGCTLSRPTASTVSTSPWTRCRAPIRCWSETVSPPSACHCHRGRRPSCPRAGDRNFIHCGPSGTSPPRAPSSWRHASDPRWRVSGRRPVAAAAGCPLIDRDPDLLARRLGAQLSTVHAVDLGVANTLPLIEAPHAIVADPPWYAPHPQRWFTSPRTPSAAEGPSRWCCPRHCNAQPPPHNAAPCIASRSGSVLPLSSRAPFATRRRTSSRLRWPPPAWAWVPSGGAPICWSSPSVTPTHWAPCRRCPGPPTRRRPSSSARSSSRSARGSERGRHRCGPSPTPANFVWNAISRRDPRVPQIDLWTFAQSGRDRLRAAGDPSGLGPAGRGRAHRRGGHRYDAAHATRRSPRPLKRAAQTLPRASCPTTPLA